MTRNEDNRNDPDGSEALAPGSRPGSSLASLIPLLVCLGVLVGAWFIEATPESATLFGLEGPPCPSRWLPESWGLHGAGCPGCGLTRATAMAVQGRVTPSLQMHSAGVIVALLAAAGSFLHGWMLLLQRRPDSILRLLGVGRWIFLGALLYGWWTRLV